MSSLAVGALLALGSLGVGPGSINQKMTFEITLTNLTHGVVLTPPLFSLSERQIDVFEPGTPASLGLEMLAEGGITDELRAELEQKRLQDVVQADMPVPPGQSITVELRGNRWSRLNLAAMLVPTNDGFVALNGEPATGQMKRTVFYLNAFDAGTEMNDETCDTIPGPQCGGEGFNAEGGEGFVTPHPGTHGEAELSRRAYNWGDPVAEVRVRVIHP